jgi:7-cyano-7-deazaguanine synthase
MEDKMGEANPNRNRGATVSGATFATTAAVAEPTTPTRPWPSLQKIPRSALVVFSGGQDSTTCLHWAMGVFARVETLFFDYGQRHLREREAAEAIATRLQLPFRVFRLDFFREMGGNALIDAGTTISDAVEGHLPNTFVPGRNLLFLSQAGAYAAMRGISDVVAGMCQTDYSGYPDCREASLRPLEEALHQGLGFADEGNRFHVHLPLMHLTKAQSVKLAQQVGAMESLALSHTCYAGTKPPCGECPACRLRAKGFTEAGLPDPLRQEVQ